MVFRRIYSGADFTAVESHAFSEIDDRVGEQPESVLYLARSGHDETPTIERWTDVGSPLSLSFTTFDRFVADCLEHATYQSRSTHMDQQLRNRFVELALENLDESHPLATSGRLPSAGLCEQAENLLSLVEFAGLLSPDAIVDRFENEGLSAKAGPVGDFKAAFDAARRDVLGDSIIQSTLRGERYADALSSDVEFERIFPSIDVVILSGFSLFSPLEYRLVEQIAETWDTIAILPQIHDTDRAIGIDTGAERAFDAYHDLDFEHHYHRVDEEQAHRDRWQVTRRLYRHPDEFTDPYLESPADLEWVQPATLPHEIRYLARDIRERIEAGESPDDLAVILTQPSAYRNHLLETFDTYDIPVALTTEQSLGTTAVGDLIYTLCELTAKPRQLETVTSLYANQLLAPERQLAIDHTELTRVVARLSSDRLETAHPHLDPSTQEALERLFDSLEALKDASLDELPSHVDQLFDELGVRDSLESIADRRTTYLEQQALERIDRALETLAMTADSADLKDGDSISRLERALASVTLEAPSTRSDGHVLVGGLGETMEHEYSHVYIAGLTMGQFPSEIERLAFARPINEAHDDFQQADTQLRARYQFGTLLTSHGSVTISTPARKLDGDPFIEADVLTELRRVTDIEPHPVTESDQQPGSREDVQRSMAHTIAYDEDQSPSDLINRATTHSIFTPTQCTRLYAGTECGQARQSPQPSPYDGIVSAELTEKLHSRASREPYSPSQLETYARCGFKYYMERVLEIEEQDDITLDPDAKARGGYIHDVFEQYYRSQQTADGEPVDVRRDREQSEQELLTIALDLLEERFADDGTIFHAAWLTEVLAGLGEPSQNPYYGSSAFGSEERGLFSRFIKHERDEVGTTTVSPAWFEARVGAGYEDNYVLSEESISIETPTGEVRIAGKIDRIDTTTGETPRRLVVRDYKTGSTPSEEETLEGLRFQLPLYGVMAQELLDDVDVVGGAYYQVKPPRRTNHRKGQIGSQEYAAHARSGDAPLLYWRKPEFETHAKFQAFLSDVIPQRLGELTKGLKNGWFHPTILEPTDAGCSYCAYKQVCDVRTHQRRDTIESVDADGQPVYVPIAGTDGALDIDQDGGA